MRTYAVHASVVRNLRDARRGDYRMTDISTAAGNALRDAVCSICGRHGDDPAALLEILHELQDEWGCVEDDAVPMLADALNLSRAEVHGVVSFYHDFRTSPAGRVTVKMCRAEACQSMGALKLIEDICTRMGVPLGGNGDDARVTIEPVYCLGNCALAPAALIDGRPMGRADIDKLENAIAEAAA